MRPPPKPIKGSGVRRLVKKSPSPSGIQGRAAAKTLLMRIKRRRSPVVEGKLLKRRKNLRIYVFSYVLRRLYYRYVRRSGNMTYGYITPLSVINC